MKMKQRNIKHPKRKKTRRLLSVMTAAALCITSVSIPFSTKESKAESATEKSASELSNPTTDSDGVTTWDCIYFGNYWQNDTNGDGTADQSDDKEPIKWRVLSVDGDDVFLLADQNLDCQPYNKEYEDVTWETCTLRTWLNDTFLTNAFSAEEQAAIKSTTVVNDDNPEYGTEGGNNTTDKVYLLSIAEAGNTAYGFDGTFLASSKTREAKSTAYARTCGAYTPFAEEYLYNSYYFCLRSPGLHSAAAAYVCYDGWGDYYGSNVHNSGLAVRPALHVNLSRLNLSSSSLWSYAGEVTVDGGGAASQTTQPPTATHIPSTSELSNPTTDSNGVTTWDCIYFGNYWQNDTNGDGTADRKDTKEPIKWRVLSVDGDDVFLLADQNLDGQPYKTGDEDVTWETSILRTWLNKTFMNQAFSEEEQSDIKETEIRNEDSVWGTEGGNNTEDKIFLLSVEEAVNPAYGFDSDFEAGSETRKVKSTEYKKDMCDLSGNYEDAGWWLRTPGYSGDLVSYVWAYGFGDYMGNGSWDRKSVRPALHLKLSSAFWWSAGTVSAKTAETSSVSKPSGTTAPSSSGLSNPIIENGVTTWDCVWLGNYWQNDTNGDGTADQNDTKEPIKWRVLSVNGNDAFLLADQNLDCQKYNETAKAVLWKDCTLRTWLNETFIAQAFSEEEQDALKVTTLVNSDYVDDSEEVNNTEDKVFLLSADEVRSELYGFEKKYRLSSDTRTVKNTAYAKESGAYTLVNGDGFEGAEKWIGNGVWWLRSPSFVPTGHLSAVYLGGQGLWEHNRYNSYWRGTAVRPALHLDLSSTVWSPAGTVSSDGTEASIPPTGASVPTLTPSLAPTASAPAPSAAPTGQSQASVTSTVTPVSTLAPTITPPAAADTTLTKTPSVQLKSLKASGKGKAKAEWKKVTKIDGYRLQYAQDKKFKKKVKTKWLAAKKKSVTLTGLKKKKTYYVRICAYALSDGKKVYGKWSNIKKVKIKK